MVGLLGMEVWNTEGSAAADSLGMETGEYAGRKVGSAATKVGSVDWESTGRKAMDSLGTGESAASLEVRTGNPGTLLGSAGAGLGCQ